MQNTNDLEQIFSVFHKLANQSLSRGLFTDTGNVVILHQALEKFKSIIDGQKHRKGEGNIVDSSPGNTTGRTARKRVPKKKAETKETAAGTETGNGSEFVEQPLPFSE